MLRFARKLLPLPGVPKISPLGLYCTGRQSCRKTQAGRPCAVQMDISHYNYIERGLICTTIFKKTKYTKGANTMQKTPTCKVTNQEGAPPRFTQRIGSTVYEASIHFSETSKETVEDKILRMLKSEVYKSA